MPTPRYVWLRVDDKFPELTVGPEALSDMQHAQRTLAVTFDSACTHVLLHFSGSIVGPFPIFGTRAAHARPARTVVTITQQVRRRGWPGTTNWSIMSTDHAGHPIGLAPCGRVMISDHDHGGIDVLAARFEDDLSWCLHR